MRVAPCCGGAELDGPFRKVDAVQVAPAAWVACSGESGGGGVRQPPHENDTAPARPASPSASANSSGLTPHPTSSASSCSLPQAALKRFASASTAWGSQASAEYLE